MTVDSHQEVHIGLRDASRVRLGHVDLQSLSYRGAAVNMTQLLLSSGGVASPAAPADHAQDPLPWIRIGRPGTTRNVTVSGDDHVVVDAGNSLTLSSPRVHLGHDGERATVLLGLFFSFLIAFSASFFLTFVLLPEGQHMHLGAASTRNSTLQGKDVFISAGHQLRLQGAVVSLGLEHVSHLSLGLVLLLSFFFSFLF